MSRGGLPPVPPSRGTPSTPGMPVMPKGPPPPPPSGAVSSGGISGALSAAAPPPPSLGGSSARLMRENTRPVSIASDSLEPWIHGSIDREEAEVRLRRDGIHHGLLRDGTFLVRESKHHPGAYSLSVTYDGGINHYLIERLTGNSFQVVGTSTSYPSLSDLVNAHRKESDRLCTRLRHATLRRDEEPDVKFRQGGWEVKRGDVAIGEKLGAGQFGDVVAGTWRGSPVAIKTLKGDSEDKMLSSDFLLEASVMTNLSHPNLVQLLGVCTDPDGPVLILSEFMSKGCIQMHLRRARRSITPAQLLDWCTQCAVGMAYLEQNKFIHRDLACRNVLLDGNNVAKVADFGLARRVKNDIYNARSGQVIAIKWTAPESIQHEVYTIKSDVWSYGILMWEIYSFGMQPYPGVEKKDVVKQVNEGYRMGAPESCQPPVYQVMKSCWELEPRMRPSFKDIAGQLKSCSRA